MSDLNDMIVDNSNEAQAWLIAMRKELADTAYKMGLTCKEIGEYFAAEELFQFAKKYDPDDQRYRDAFGDMRRALHEVRQMYEFS